MICEAISDADIMKLEAPKELRLVSLSPKEVGEMLFFIAGLTGVLLGHLQSGLSTSGLTSLRIAT